MNKHFLTLLDRTPTELTNLVDRALELKSRLEQGQIYSPLTGKTLALIFEKSSTRTRVSFEAAMSQLGGNCIFLSPDDSQLGRGEPLEDTARVLSGMVEAVVIRTASHDRILKFAEFSSIPVINGLTDDYHPCQLLADVLTIVEKLGSVKGKVAAWIGDGNNVCHSWINAAKQFDFQLRIATPPQYEPNQMLITNSGGHAEIVDSPQLAVEQSQIVVTDTWASMGQEDQKEQPSSAPCSPLE